jgi:predicted HicB family RNase H-like nuclease
MVMAKVKEKKNVNLKVDPDLWQAAKLAALKQGIELREFVSEALRDKLKKKGG